MLTSTIVDCRSEGKRCRYRRPQNRRLSEFLRDIGFNKFFKLRDQIDERRLIASPRVQLRRCSGLDYDIIQELTQLFEYHLNLSTGVVGSIRMSLQEAITNVVDHSGVTDYYVCAYSYPEQRLIRICIADLGIGILSSLKETKKYPQIRDDYAAIRVSTEEGVTSRTTNAGLGLTHIKNFIKVNEGQLCIMSGRGKVFWKYDHGKIMNQKMEIPFQGTLLKMLINIDKEGYYFLSEEEDYIF